MSSVSVEILWYWHCVLFPQRHVQTKSLSISWWRHQMETFPALLALCAGNSPVPGEFPSQRPVTQSFDVFFDLCLNKRLGKQSWGWWFETLPRPFWRHSKVNSNLRQQVQSVTLHITFTFIDNIVRCVLNSMKVEQSQKLHMKLISNDLI